MTDFTRREIKKTFRKLLEERPLNSITVRDIADGCGISRSSFYYHYPDIPALLEEVVRENADNFVAETTAPVASSEELTSLLRNFILKKKSAAMHVYHSLRRDIFEEYLSRTCRYISASFIQNARLSGEDADRMQSMIQLYSYLLFGFALEWLKNGLDEDVAVKFWKTLDEMRIGKGPGADPPDSGPAAPEN